MERWRLQKNKMKISQVLQKKGSRVSRTLSRPTGRAFLSLLFILFCAATCTAQVDPVDWVNLYIGTGSGPIGYGGTMPFVTPPFGMTNWTAQTRQNNLSVVSYKYEDTAISGFMGTHQPAIWMGDYGYVTLMPANRLARDSPEARQMAFQSRR